MSDTTNGTVNADVQPVVEKLPTLAISVTPLLEKFIATFQYTINDNVVMVDDVGLTMVALGANGETVLRDVGYSRLLPNSKGVTPKAEAYNGTLADSNALKLHLYVEANAKNPVEYPAVDFLSDDELSIARLIPSERKAKSETAQLNAILKEQSAKTGMSIETLTAMLMKAALSNKTT